jgi:hypothetical protein
VASVIAGNGGGGMFAEGAGGSLTSISIDAANDFEVEFTPGEGSPPGKVTGVVAL